MEKYSHQINIHSKDQKLTFYATEYHVDLIGGVDISLNDFSIVLIDENGLEVNLTTFTLPVQRLYGWTRARKTFGVNIPTEGVYTIRFNNPSSLIVKRSNAAMFPFSLFNKPISNQKISVVFYRKE